MRRLGRFVLLTSMLLAVVCLSRCQVIGGFAGDEVVDPGEGGQGGSMGAGGGGSTGDECTLLHAPLPPTDAASGAEVTFTLAARSIELGEQLNVPLGLDLDDACTCSANEACPCASVPTCTRPPIVASDDDWQSCDEPGGVDANSRRLFGAVHAFEELLSSAFISAAIAAGGGSTLFDVRQYNGLADDDAVFVGVYTAGAFKAAECNDAAPSWSGEDAWPIDKQSVLGELTTCGGKPSPTVFDAYAYVTNYQLVAHLTEVRLVISIAAAGLGLTVRDAIAVVPLERSSEGRWSTTGATLAGRWELADVFRALGEVNDLTPTLDLCGSELASMQATACSAADTATHTDAGGACDAVSFALEFDAEEARFGNTVDLPATTSCPEFLALDCETPVQ